LTAELSIHIEGPVSTKTFRQDIHKTNIHGRAAIAKPLITKSNAKRRKKMCCDHKSWTSDGWKYVIRSEELSTFMLFPTSSRVYVWRTPKGASNPECLLSTEKHGGGCVTIRVAVSCYTPCPIIILNVIITACVYMDILGNQVDPMIQMLFPVSHFFLSFQNDILPIHLAGSVLS
jgi:hypothetical protein